MAQKLFDAEQSVIVGVEMQGAEICFHELSQLSTPDIKISRNLVSQVINGKTPIVFDDIHSSDFNESSYIREAQSLIGIPILIADKVAYIIFGYTKKISRVCGENQLRLAVFASHLLSAALENLSYIREIEESKKRFQTIIDAAPNALVLEDPSAKIILVNQEAEILFGYKREELLGKDIKLILPQRVANTITFTFENSTHTEKETKGKRRDGSLIDVEVGLTAIHTQGGISVVSAIIDISDRKRVEQELRVQRDRLQESNEELERFAYVASHDLQEPLRAVRSWSQILLGEIGSNVSAEGKEAFEFIMKGADRMSSLIRALLDYSRAARGGREREATPMKDLIEQALANLATVIKESKSQVILEGEFPTLEITPVLFTQVFQNLIGNGIKFKGEANPIIHISSRRSENREEWNFCVKDNGIGIQPKHQARIFEAFKRLHTQEEYEGSGIGLSIAKKVIEHHGGRIWVESEAGQGAKFCFSLPAGAASRSHI